MSKPEAYRRIASEHRIAAKQSRLPNVRKRHLEAAERMEAIAEQLERGAASAHPAFTQQIFK